MSFFSLCFLVYYFTILIARTELSCYTTSEMCQRRQPIVAPTLDQNHLNESVYPFFAFLEQGGGVFRS